MSSPSPSSWPSPSALSYVPALDGFRAIAALVVVGDHARIPGFGHGEIGVYLFFTLSGFLITRILIASLERGPLDYWEFYRRRGLRLLPAYVAVLVVCLLIEPFSDVGGTIKGAASSALYVSNWLAAFGVGLGSLAHTWTLSIEEQFYVLWPALFVTVWRGTPTAWILGLMCLSWLLTALLIRADVLEDFVGAATPTVALHLLAGCALATWSHRRRMSVGALGPLALAGLLVIVATHPPGTPVLAWPIIAAGSVVVIISALEGGSVTRVLAWRPLVAVGKVSYGLYLWNAPIFAHLDFQLSLDAWGPRILGLAMTATVVPLCYSYIEQPFLRMKDSPIFSREWFRMRALTRVGLNRGGPAPGIERRKPPLSSRHVGEGVDEREHQ